MSEKTEEATPKKKRKARQDGQLARSAEFSGVAVMLAATATVVVAAPIVGERLAALTIHLIEVATRPELDAQLATATLEDALVTLGLVLAPILGVAFVIAALVAYLQVGAVFTIKPLIPDPKRLDPIKGAKNIVSKAKLVELVKNIAKLSLMGTTGYMVLRDRLPLVVLMPRLELFEALVVCAQIALRLTLYLVAGLVMFGVIDLFWQRYKHAKQLRMSKDEVKREYKESEGDPMVKGQRRQFHQELINEAGTARVREADAVVVNPTHVAAAIFYREEQMGAPQVIARGRGELAQEIKRLARRYGVPIVHDVPLARALVELDLEREIPEDLFEPVAEVLRFVYSLKKEGST